MSFRLLQIFPNNVEVLDVCGQFKNSDWRMYNLMYDVFDCADLQKSYYHLKSIFLTFLTYVVI